MRLLSSTSLKFEEFINHPPDRYAILSHRWKEGEEVSFQEMQSGGVENKSGYKKIKLCCDQAAKDGIDYAWVDTCCIDKTIGAELSESINSMYRWYQNAAVCYVYLSDVLPEKHTNFTKSAWFTRGWTLQELIAPPEVEFYDSNWVKIGTKQTLKHAISAETGIDVQALGRTASPEDFSIAQRMCWASRRTTKKGEDLAYSLLGILGVNMPLIYGEGEKAFIRLQEELIKHSTDHSIFAWTSDETGYRGMFAKSPADFRNCQKTVISKVKFSRMSYSVKNIGLKITLPLLPWAMDTYLATLDCLDESGRHVGIYLRRLEEEDQYARVSLNGVDTEMVGPSVIRKSQHKKIYVPQKIRDRFPHLSNFYGFWLRSFPAPSEDENGNASYFATSYNEWDNNKRLFEIPKGERGTAGVITYRSKIGLTVLKLGFDFMFNPICQFGPVQDGKLDFEPERASFEAIMSNDWLDHTSDQIMKGDRKRGIDVYEPGVQILLSQTVIGNHTVWAVDISVPEAICRIEGIGCSGCYKVSTQNEKCSKILYISLNTHSLIL
jgi:hypothetical protein